MKICENEGCGIAFTPATHNQIFHDAECCRLSTNRRIMEKYYDRRDQLAGKARYCNKCEIKLSRYNNSLTCSSCELKATVSANQSVVDMLLSINWQAA